MVQRRFVRRGTALYKWLSAVADPEAGPTRAELAAGIDCTADIAGITGFSVSSTTIPTPDMGSRWESSIPGNLQSQDSSLRFYDDLDSDELDTTFTRDQEGFIVIMRKGDAVAGAGATPKPMETWPARVSSFAPSHSVDMTAADLTVSFSITSEPFTEQIVPAAA